MTPPAPLKVRVVRIWPTSNPAHLRIEYDPRADGTFSGMWIPLQSLRERLTWLYPDMPEDDAHSAVSAVIGLVRQGDLSKFIEVKRELPAEPQALSQEPAAEITDFSW